MSDIQKIVAHHFCIGGFFFIKYAIMTRSSYKSCINASDKFCYMYVSS